MNASSIRKIPGVAPFFFMKPPSTSLVGPGRTVRIPPGCHYFDWEVEVAVIIGRGGRDIPESRAMRHVAGYSVGIDFTARDLFFQPESFFKFNFTLGKAQDTMSPLGPVVVPAAFLPRRPALNFGLWVNGVRKQFASTADMIYSISEQIAGISRSVTLDPADVIFTGSPAGVGLPRGEKLAPGDRVRVAADYVGEMEVVIRA
jgi:2-keto-4-pentenoate hydratase/2-oxohepta-3-ene-1,7-dioic acid hydratase in catechol pathway